MRKVAGVSFTLQELISFTEKMLDHFCRDCCPSCEAPLGWRDCHEEDEIKSKIEEVVIEFTK